MPLLCVWFCYLYYFIVLRLSSSLSVNILIFESSRTGKADGACSVSKEHLEVHFEQENTQLDGCNSKIACARNRTVPEENSSISESEQKSLKTSKPHSGMDEVYKSPVVPEAKIFQAVVSCVGSDGTIYIIPKSFGEFTQKKIHL